MSKPKKTGTLRDLYKKLHWPVNAIPLLADNVQLTDVKNRAGLLMP